MSTEKTFTIGQYRAKFALDCVDVLSKSGQVGNYVSYVKALPATVLQSGLGQALATELAAAKGVRTDPHYQLFSHVESWLCHADHGIYRDSSDVLKAIMSHDEELYLVAQGEALAFLSWLKKFAVAYLTPDEPQAAAGES